MFLLQDPLFHKNTFYTKKCVKRMCQGFNESHVLAGPVQGLLDHPIPMDSNCWGSATYSESPQMVVISWRLGIMWVWKMGMASIYNGHFTKMMMINHYQRLINHFTQMMINHKPTISPISGYFSIEMHVSNKPWTLWGHPIIRQSQRPWIRRPRLQNP